MTSYRRSVLFLIALAIGCGTQSPEPEDDEGTGGQAASTGGASTGGASTGGMNGSTGGGGSGATSGGSGGDPSINPETGLSNDWELVFQYEGADSPTLLDDAGLMITRTIDQGEFTTDDDYDYYYLAAGESIPTHLLTNPDWLDVKAQDESFIYVSYTSPENDAREWVGRIAKPEDPAGLGGGPGAPTGLDPVVEHEGSNPDVAYFGQNDTQVFFIYNSTSWFEGHIWSVDKSSGEEELVDLIEGLGTSSPGLIVDNELHVVIDTGELSIVSGSTVAGEKEITGSVPDLCDNLVRNSARDGWWALCTGDSGTALVSIDLDGVPTTIQEGVPWTYIYELFPGEPYVRGFVPNSEDLLQLYAIESGELLTFPMEGTDYLGVVDGYVYARNGAHSQVVRAALPE